MTEATIFVSGILLRTVIGEMARAVFRQFLDGSERRTSIFLHYMAQARGQGHQSEWAECHQDKCGTV